MKTHPVHSSPVRFYQRVTAVEPFREKMPLKQLQECDVYFSSQSSRAKIDRLLDTPEESSLLFNFMAGPQSPALAKTVQPARGKSVVLLLERINTPDSFEGPTKDEFTKNTSLKNEASNPNAKDIPLHLQWIHYEPVTNPTLLLHASQLDFSPAESEQTASGNASESSDNVLKAPSLIQRRIAFIPKTGTLITLDSPDAATNNTDNIVGESASQELPSVFPVGRIIERKRPLLDKLHQLLRQVLLGGKLGPIRFGEDGQITVLNRWQFNPIHYWEDERGHRAELYNLAKLPNGILADVKEKKVIGTFPSSEGLFRKALKERILSEMETVEKQGYVLIPEPVSTVPAKTTEIPEPVFHHEQPEAVHMPVATKEIEVPVQAQVLNTIEETQFAEAQPLESPSEEMKTMPAPRPTKPKPKKPTKPRKEKSEFATNPFAVQPNEHFTPLVTHPDGEHTAAKPAKAKSAAKSKSAKTES